MLIIILLVSSCGGEAEDNLELLSIKITPENASINVSDESQFKAIGVYVDGFTRDITNDVDWTSSDGAIAHFDDTLRGAFKANSIGAVSITATDLITGIYATIQVEISDEDLVSLEISSDVSTIEMGETLQLSAMGTFSGGSTRNLTQSVEWNSSGEAIATVSSKGLVRTSDAGDVVISATYNESETVTNANLEVVYSMDETLAAFYPFNGDAKDRSGNGNDGIVKGATLTEDRFGVPNRAYSFDGSSSHIVIPHNEYLTLHHSRYTIAMWVKANQQISTSNPWNVILTKSLNLSGKPFLIKYLNEFERVQVDDRNVIPIQSVKTFSDEKFHFVTIKRYSKDNKEYSQLYIDGRLEGNEVELDPTTEDSTGILDLYLGISTEQDKGFSGVIDELRIYHRALSDEEIRSQYKKSNPELESIQITPASIVLGEGDIRQFVANGTFVGGLKRDITSIIHWSSSDPEIAGISNASMDLALMRAGSEGTATITATDFDMDISAMVTLSVTPTPPLSFPLETFETGTFDDWVIGGRRENSSHFKILGPDGDGGGFAWLEQAGFSETTATKSFKYVDDAVLFFDLSMGSNDCPISSDYVSCQPGSSDYTNYGMIGFSIEFYTTSDKILGSMGFVSSTTEYPFDNGWIGYNSPEMKIYLLDISEELKNLSVPPDNTEPTHSFDISKMLNDLIINIYDIETISITFLAYNSPGGGAQMEMWFDNVGVFVREKNQP